MVYDEVDIVQVLQPTVSQNFREYAQEIFISYILQPSSRLDLVWDTHRADSLKANAREKCAKGVRECAVSVGAKPRNWPNFLQVDSNEIQMFKFFLDALLLELNLNNSNSSSLMET